MAESEESAKKSRFKTLTDNEKQAILKNRKAENTNKATDLWMTCFKQYLQEKDLPIVELLTTEELPPILSDFYSEVKKKNPTKNTKGKNNLDENDAPPCQEYKTSSLKCIRAALNQYFRSERGLDIISNEKFIKANEMFTGVTKTARQEGRGSVQHKEVITDEDLAKLKQYFTQKMEGPPDGKILQQLVLFTVIYQMGRRGHENLRKMTKATFKVGVEADGRKYLYQAIDEHSKNYTEKDTEKSNQARIYEQRGN